jgi:hypothetical protein
MTLRTSSTSTERNLGCVISLFMLAGVLFIIDAGLLAYPLIRDRLLPPPASFGEAQPLVRLTVTPASIESQTPITAAPALLPETPLLAPAQTLHD